MKYKIDNNIYEVEIIRKNNKNTYVRVKDGKIVVTTSFLTTKLTVTKILDDNVSFLKKALYKDLKKQEKVFSISVFSYFVFAYLPHRIAAYTISPFLN